MKSLFLNLTTGSLLSTAIFLSPLQAMDHLEGADSLENRASSSLPQHNTSQSLEAKAFDALTLAANQGDAEAQYKVARAYQEALQIDKIIFEEGLFTQIPRELQPTIKRYLQKDRYLELASTHYKLAAEQKHVHAQYEFFVIHENDSDFQNTLHDAELAAGQEHQDVQEKLPAMDKKPFRSRNLALHYFQRHSYLELAANQGHRKAQFSLAGLYEEGRGVEQNLQKAFRYYKRAADQGHREAQFSLACMYEDGQGVEQNFQKTFHYYKLAADQGHREAQYELACMYEDGQGVEQNFQKAFHYYKLAADQGDRDAQRIVGSMYEDAREYVEPDLEEACRYYELAAKQGCITAKEDLERLQQRMERK